MNSIRRRRAWNTANPDSPFQAVTLACLVAFLSFLTAKLGGALVLRPQMVWPLWPGCAFLVGVLLSVPRRLWPILIAAGLGGFVLYDLQAGLKLRSLAVLILADTVEVLIATLGVSYSFRGLPHLNSVKSLASYSLFAVILAPMASAFIATAAFSSNHWIRWRIGFFTEALALLTLTPSILGWVSRRQAWMHKSRAFYFEAAALIAGLSLLGYVALVAPGRSGQAVPLYSLLPFLLWSALRFGSMGTSTSMIVVAFLSIWGAVHGRGPFTGSEPLNNVMSLQLFLFFAATPFMVLAVLVEEERQTEQGLRESEKRFRLLADTAPVLIWMAGTDKLCTYFNKTWLDFTGRSIDFEIGNGWAEGIHPEDLRRCMDTFTQAFDRREEFRMEYRLRRRDGEYRWILDIGVPRFSQDRSFIGYIGIGIDVTERKHAEEALRESENRFRLAAQAGKMFAYEWDAATDVILRTAEAAQILGVDEAAHTTGQQTLTKVHPDDRERLLAAVAALSPDKPDLQLSYRVVRPDGSVIWVDRTSRAHFDEQGKMLRMVGMVVDITERRRAEEAKRESEDKLQLLLDSTAEAIYGMDLEGRCTFCNPACLRALGYERVDELLGKNMHDLIHHTRADGTLFPVEDCPIFRVFRTGEGVHADDEVLWRANRTSFPAEYWSYPQRRGQKVVGAVVAFIDVTQRKLAEAALASVSRRLIEAQEQERTRIARELHDDFAQRLALLAVELEQLHQNPPNLPEVRRRLGELQKRTSEIALDLQSLSHELHSAKLQYLGVGAAMRGFCQEFGEQTKVKIDFKSHDLPGPLSPDISLCLFRVLQEALHNSAKHSGVRHVEVELWGTSNEVHLTVGDSGAGFDRESAKRSQGLGLISMEERLKLVKGTFSIESQPKRGTTIHARVPLGSGSDSMRAAG